jgi:hypothetical protein
LFINFLFDKNILLRSLWRLLGLEGVLLLLFFSLRSGVDPIEFCTLFSGGSDCERVIFSFCEGTGGVGEGSFGEEEIFLFFEGIWSDSCK